MSKKRHIGISSRAGPQTDRGTLANAREWFAEDVNPNTDPSAEGAQAALKSVSHRADEALVQERYVEAEQLYSQLVKGLGELLSPDHLEVAGALHKLAAAVGAQGRTGEARELERRVNLIQTVHEEHAK